MSDYSHVNLTEVEDQAPNLGLDPEQFNLRFGRVALNCEHCGVSYLRLAPGAKAHGHRHKVQEEIYVLVTGSAEMKVGDDELELQPFHAVRVPPHAMRGIKGGPEGCRDRSPSVPPTPVPATGMRPIRTGPGRTSARMNCSACGAENRAGRSSAPAAARRWPWPALPVGPRTSPTTASAASAGPARAGLPLARARRGRATACVGPLRRPGRLHAALGGAATPKRCASCFRATSSRAAADRPLRRHGREVHRRRGDGGLGHAGRARGRRRAGRPRGARARRGRRRARRRGRTPELRRAPASLTGEAAVTIGAEGEGMVAGDLVNTASRVQSAAEPGTVLVGDGPGARPRPRSPTTTRVSTR